MTPSRAVGPHSLLQAFERAINGTSLGGRLSSLGANQFAAPRHRWETAWPQLQRVEHQCSCFVLMQRRDQRRFLAFEALIVLNRAVGQDRFGESTELLGREVQFAQHDFEVSSVIDLNTLAKRRNIYLVISSLFFVSIPTRVFLAISTDIIQVSAIVLPFVIAFMVVVATGDIGFGLPRDQTIAARLSERRDQMRSPAHRDYLIQS